MITRAFLHTICLALSCFAISPSLLAKPVLTEKAKIETLIAHLETLDGATFIRNGKDYDARTAARFLRGKWQAHDEEIKTAADFIAKAATSSSTTGKPYVLRFKDGTTTPCGDYLTAQLKKPDSAPPDKRQAR